MTLALALLVASGTAGQAAPLTEADAVAAALRNSPQIKSRDHFVVESQALTQASLAWNNPHLRVGGLRYDELLGPLIDSRSYGDHPLYHASVALRWSPPGLGERGARRAEGMAREEAARMELAFARRDTVALVRRLHAQILSLDAQIALARDVIEQQEKLRTLVKNRLDQAMATSLDQALTEVDYLNARTELAGIEVSRRAASDELLIQSGLPAEASLQLAATDQTVCVAPADAAGLANRAHGANPRLRLLEAEERAVDAQRTRRWLDLVPWVDYLQLAYGFAGDSRDSYVALQFQLTLPLFDWKGPHRLALAARKEGLAQQVHAEDRMLSDTVVRLVAAQAAQAAMVERYRAAASVVEGGLDRLRQALLQGQITNLFEVVQLQTRLLATKRSYLRAELECKLQRIEIDRITSTGLEK